MRKLQNGTFDNQGIEMDKLVEEGVVGVGKSRVVPENNVCNGSLERRTRQRCHWKEVNLSGCCRKDCELRNSVYGMREIFYFGLVKKTEGEKKKRG